MVPSKELKCIFLSDTHGHLPDIDECDVVGICGDIVPLDIQRDTIKSVVWFSREFVPWAMRLNCKRVIFIAGNHDFFLQDIVRNRFKGRESIFSKSNQENMAAEIIRESLALPEKIVYLQDTEYEFCGFRFYGTPWIPTLRNWAFYKDTDELAEKFAGIPENIDVLMTHSPGKGVNDTGVAKEVLGFPEYGSKELTDALLNIRTQNRPKLWVCGHIHTGEHMLTEFDGISVANVSIKNESYKQAFLPLETTIFRTQRREPHGSLF